MLEVYAVEMILTEYVTAEHIELALATVGVASILFKAYARHTKNLTDDRIAAKAYRLLDSVGVFKFLRVLSLQEDDPKKVKGKETKVINE